MKHSFCWLQLQSTNAPESKKFYTALFDWKLTENAHEEHPYTHIDTGEGAGGGIMATPNGVPSHWMPYISVANLKEHTQKAEQLGAIVIVPPTPTDGGGNFSVIQDPTGAFIGLYQA